MPLVDRAESTLVVAFEWLRTVDNAARTLRAAKQRFAPPPLRP